jgi:hypothetical protein
VPHAPSPQRSVLKHLTCLRKNLHLLAVCVFGKSGRSVKNLIEKVECLYRFAFDDSEFTRAWGLKTGRERVKICFHSGIAIVGPDD